MKTKTNHFTSTRLTSGVRQRASIFIAALFCSMLLSSVASAAPLTGTKNIPSDGAPFDTLANAIAELNAQGVGAGGVTLNLEASNPETAPAGGYVIGGAGSMVLTTSSAANPVIIQGNANTITASAAQVVGNLNDAIFKLIGADWITITGFTMQENAANTVTVAATNNMTEWGVALLYVTATDGAQNDTISNNTISLNRTYPNTFGIYSNSTHTATAVTTSATATGAAGGNENLKVYGNNISNVNMGIVHIGPTAAADQNITADIGGAALATGNTITDFGTTTTGLSSYANLSATINGILVRNTKSFNISFNTVNSSNGGVVVGTLNGIQIPASSNAPTGVLTQTINNNSISLRPGAIGIAMVGITMPSTSVNATTTCSINNNDFNTFGHTVAGATGTIGFISQGGNPLVQNINNNTFTNMSVNTTGTITFFSFAPSLISTASMSLSGNMIVTGFTRTGVGTTTVYSTNASSVAGSTMANSNNNFSNITLTGASAFNGILNTDGGAPVKTINGNTFSNITTGAGTVVPMSVNFSGPGTTVNNNTITGITTSNSITALLIGSSNAATITVSGNTIDPIISGGTAVIGISTAAPSAVLSKNKIYDLSGTVAGSVVSGIAVVNTTSSSTVTLSNNLIGNLTAPAATGANAVIGISLTGSATTSNYNVFYNTVYVSNPTSGTGFGSSGISTLASATATTSTLNLRNNVIVNTSVQNGAGLTVAYRRSAGGAGTLANYASTSNNNDFFSSNLIYSDGTSTAATLAAYRNGVFTAGTVAPRDSASVTENPPFISTTGSSADFLHITATSTQLESGGANIGGITDDFDGNIRQGNPGYVGTGTAPDIGADEFGGTPLDLTPPLISYTTLGNGIVAGTRTFSNVTVTDASGVNIAGGTRPRVYYKKSTDADNNFNTNTNATTGWKFVEADGAGGSPFTFTIDYSRLFGGSVSLADTIQYFVVAQDLATTPNVGINSGTFASQPSSVDLIGAFPITGTINSYNIVGTIAGPKSVGGGGDYPTLTGAGGVFADINGKVLTGDVTVTVIGDLTEDGTNALNQWAEAGAGGYTVTIQPDSAAIRTISGSVALSGMIRLNGADRVTFDGRFGGSGQFLRFRNINTSNPTFTFLNDATSNTIESCLVESGNTSATSGTIVFSTSTGTLGNSGNTIHLCDIRDRSDAAGVPGNGVYSSGSAGAPNGTNTVSGCNVFNFTNAGVLVTATGAGNGWVVNPSSFYSTAARTTALTAISIQGGSGHSILNNSIGGTAPLAAGANLATSSTFVGISLAVGTASPTSVQGNVIKNIRSTVTGFTASGGIVLTAGSANIGNISGNTVGSAVVAERFEINGDSTAINVSSAAPVNVSNNVINNFGTSVTTPPSTGEFYFGMQVSGAGAHTIVNNTITNVTNFSVPDSSFNTQTIGMNVSATGSETVRGNIISNVGSTSTAAPAANNNRVWGMILSGTAVGTVVEKNIISNLYASSAGAGARVDVITCLQSQSVANGTYSNNMVSTTGSSDGVTPSDRAIFGILDLSATPAVSNYYFNSVNITGTATAANSTYAFNRNSTATVTIRDNIFADTRAGGTGFHVAMANSNAAATGWAATASDWNDLVNVTPANLCQWLGALAANNRDLTGWQAAQGAGTPGSGGDANAISADPGFVTPADLHLSSNTSPAADAGIPFGGITTDIDGNTRSLMKPDIGADEIASDNLSNLTLSPGTLSPAFAPATTSYTANVPNGTSCITVTPTAFDINALIEVQVNGGGYTAVPPYICLPVSVGPNTIDIKVTPEFGPFGPSNRPSAPTAGTPKIYTVTVTVGASVTYDGNGNDGGTAPVDTTSYFSGDMVTVMGPGSLTLTGYTFNHWNTAADNSGISYNTADTFTSAGTNVTLYAQWSINTYQLSVVAGTGGTITAPPSSPVTVNHGAATTITAVADAGYTFSGWAVTTGTGSIANAGNASTTITLTAGDATVTASFTLNTYQLSVVAGTGGTITAPPSSPVTVNHGAATTITAVADAGYTFSGWAVTTGTGSIANAGNASTTITLTAGDATVTASFTPNTYQLSVIAGTGGTITAPPTSPVTVNPGDPTTITASANAGYTFSGWTVTVGTASIADPSMISTTVTLNSGDATVQANFTGVVAVAATMGTANATYPTLKGAFDKINDGTHKGMIAITINGNTAEGASAALNAGDVLPADYSMVTIMPSGARTVSGSVATALVDLNGADNVMINGLNSVGNSLTISNTSTGTSASTIRLINGAMNNTVTNCSVLGSSTGAVAGASGNILISTSAGGANSGNTISNNNIGPAAAAPALPTKGITSLGSASPNNNSGNVIDNNNIFDFFSPTIAPAGISLQSNTTTTTVSNNRLYQTAPRTFTGAGLGYSGITATLGTGTATITGNKIGFGAADGTGTTTISGSSNTFGGISVSSASTVTPTSIQNNTVSGISQTSSGNGVVVFSGIFFAAGRFDVGTDIGNKVGSLDGSSTITITLSSAGAVYCIRDGSTTAISNFISKNEIGAITINGTGTGANGFRGILAGGTATGATMTVTNNQIGASGPGAITDSLVGAYAMYGIQVSAHNGVVTGNTIRNITGNSNGAVVVLSGIIVSGSTGVNTVSRNTVHSLSDTVTGGSAGAIYAIDCGFPVTANIVEGNLVHSINVTSTLTGYQIIGIIARTQGTATYKNNMIRLGLDAAGNSITTGFAISGIRDAAGTLSSNSYYFNSIYVGGTGVASASNTYCMNSDVVNTRNFVDNIFWNARSNASGGIANFAIRSAAPNAGLTSNYNDLYVTGTDGFVGLFGATPELTLNDWQMATGQDANSISANPQFVSPTGPAPTLPPPMPNLPPPMPVDLHITCASPADGAGNPVVGITTDFDNDTRDATNPDIGADEINLNAPTLVSAVSRKMHGGFGPFDINLTGIECRSGGPMRNYQVVFTFNRQNNQTVMASGAVVNAGMVTGVTSNNIDVNTTEIAVDLAQVPNNQFVTVKLLCVDDSVKLGSVSATMNLRIGDVNSSGQADSTDVGVVKFNTGSVVDGTTFRTDVSANGAINATDVNITKLGMNNP